MKKITKEDDVAVQMLSASHKVSYTGGNIISPINLNYLIGFDSPVKNDKILHVESSGTLLGYSVLNDSISELSRRVQRLEKTPQTVNAKILGLPSDVHILKSPIDVSFKIYPDEVIALIPNLELYGEGANEIEALNDLELELIDLFEDLNSLPDNKLGKHPRKWKRIINSLIEKKYED